MHDWRLLCWVMAVGHLPDEGLEDVGGREQPLAVAPLVDYESHLHTGALERLQRSGSQDTLRDKDCCRSASNRSTCSPVIIRAQASLTDARPSRLSRRRARPTSSLSSCSKTPARSPSKRRVSTSCSVRGGLSERSALSSLSTTLVGASSTQTPGEAKVDRKRIGRAMSEAPASGSFSARRSGTSSPMINER